MVHHLCQSSSLSPQPNPPIIFAQEISFHLIIIYNCSSCYIVAINSIKSTIRRQSLSKFTISSAATKTAKSPAEQEWKINLLQKRVKWVRSINVAKRKQVRRVGIFAGTEENPEFLQSIESKLDKSSKIIVACSSGGTMKPTQNLPEGQQSRPLIAAYLLVLNGYDKVFHLEGGLYKWFKEDLPIESEE